MAGRLLDTFSEKQENRPRRFNFTRRIIERLLEISQNSPGQMRNVFSKSCSFCLLERYPSVCPSRKPGRLISFEGFATPSLVHAIISERLPRLNRRGMTAPSSNETTSGHRN